MIGPASKTLALVRRLSWHAICSRLSRAGRIWAWAWARFELRYLRDKLKREVDFLVVRDRKPWFLVEVKKNGTSLSDSLVYFQHATRAKHAFQAVMDLPYVQADCFERTDPAIVPARTLLSQLI